MALKVIKNLGKDWAEKGDLSSTFSLGEGSKEGNVLWGSLLS